MAEAEAEAVEMRGTIGASEVRLAAAVVQRSATYILRSISLFISLTVCQHICDNCRSIDYQSILCRRAVQNCH